jgi:hypothetical protein
MPVISADLDPPLGSISRTAPSPTDDDYLMIAVRREPCDEPIHLLDGMDVARAPLIRDYPVLVSQDSERESANRKGRRHLCVIGSLLELGHRDRRQPYRVSFSVSAVMGFGTVTVGCEHGAACESVRRLAAGP